jgi:hypothetical protein
MENGDKSPNAIKKTVRGPANGVPTRNPTSQLAGLGVVLAGPALPKIASFGMLRMAHDVLQITGRIWVDQQKNVRKIILNPADPFAKHIQAGFAGLLAAEQVAVCLGET